MDDRAIRQTPEEPHATEQPAPAILAGRYRVVRLLGRGGMGSVYLARDALADDAPRAIKEMLATPGADATELAQTQERFAREARLLMSLSHPTLPRVYDFFSDAGRSYLVMEYVEGETLEQRIEREGPQSEAQTLAWAAGLCAALEYLHAQTPPVIFRDMAPDNVMVDASGQLHLIDFGIARIFNPAKQTDTLRFGKVGYAPPEQFGGGGQTTPQSDIFALGATLFFALSGRDPAQTPFVFPPLRTLNASVSPEVAAAVTRAVQLDPALRPADVRAFATELGLALPPLVLPPRQAALPGELEPALTSEAAPRARLIAFRMPPRSAEQINRQVRRILWGIGCFIFIMLVLMTLLGHFTPHSRHSYFPFTLSFDVIFALIFVMMLPALGLGQHAVARRRSRVRIVIGREGILFSPLVVGLAPTTKRKVVPWSALAKVQAGSYFIGATVQLFLRKRSGVHFGGSAWLSARLQDSKANLIVLGSAFEQMAREQSPAPAMTFGEALLWYWDEPARREELGPLPAPGHELEGILHADDTPPPPERWIGAPTWIAFALFVAITQLQTLRDIWLNPRIFAYTPYGAAMLALTTIGLFLVLLRAHQHDWPFKLGGLMLAAGVVMYYSSVAALNVGSYGDTIFTGRFSFPHVGFAWIIIFEVGAFAMIFVLASCLSLVGERRAAARLGYTVAETALISGALIAYAILPGLQDFADSLAASGPANTFAPVLRFAILPHLALLVIFLTYFHGTTPRIRRWTTLGVLVAGLGMIFGVTGLYAGTLWELWRWGILDPASAPAVTYIALGGYFALNVIAGALIAVFAWRKLKALSPTGRALRWRRPSPSQAAGVASA